MPEMLFWRCPKIVFCFCQPGWRFYCRFDVIAVEYRLQRRQGFFLSVLNRRSGE
jgi:hypothetical protein